MNKRTKRDHAHLHEFLRANTTTRVQIVPVFGGWQGMLVGEEESEVFSGPSVESVMAQLDARCSPTGVAS